jgi:hypothetical protein
VGAPDQLAAARDLLAETRRGLYRLLADGNGEARRDDVGEA